MNLVMRKVVIAVSLVLVGGVGAIYFGADPAQEAGVAQDFTKPLQSNQLIPQPPPSVAQSTVVEPRAATVGPSNSGENKANSSGRSSSMYERAAAYGYGNFVESAIASRQPRASLEAAKLVDRCKRIDLRVDILRDHINESQRSQQSHKNMIDLLKDEENVQRQCQSLTPTQASKSSDLLEIAAKGGELGAAYLYFHDMTVVHRRSVAQEEWLLDVLMRDARKGDIGAIGTLACNFTGNGLSPAQQAVFRATVNAAATHGEAANYAQLFLKYCQPPQMADAVADSAAVNQLVSLVERVGIAHLSGQ